MSLSLQDSYGGMIGGLLGTAMGSFAPDMQPLQSIQLSRLDLLTRLKLIGTIKEGEKLDTRTLTIQPMGLFTSFQRRASGCNRSQTRLFVWETLTAASRTSREMLSHITQSNDIGEIRKLISDLEAALKGINSLKQTYLSDRPFWCSLDTLHDEIVRDIEFYRDALKSQESKFVIPISLSITDGH